MASVGRSHSHSRDEDRPPARPAPPPPPARSFLSPPSPRPAEAPRPLGLPAEEVPVVSTEGPVRRGDPAWAYEVGADGLPLGGTPPRPSATVWEEWRQARAEQERRAEQAAAWRPDPLALAHHRAQSQPEPATRPTAGPSPIEVRQRQAASRSERQEARARRRRWAARAAAGTTVESAADLVADGAAEREAKKNRSGAEQRHAKQQRDPPRRVRLAHERWAAACEHEVRPQTLWIAPHYDVHAVGRRARVIDVGNAFGADLSTKKGVISYLHESSGLNARIASRHEVAHLVVAWPPGVVPATAEIAATSRRLCARVGIDPALHKMVAVAHDDGKTAHAHLLVARVRVDGAAWIPGLGVDRALALEARSMALDLGQEWDQRMIERSATSAIAAQRAARGELAGELVWEAGRRERVSWQGPDVAARIEDDSLAAGAHAGQAIVRLVGFRPVESVVSYVLS